MLKSLTFKNYRCFLEHDLPLNQETIMVGKNNAGKSTIVEGMRLLAIITQRYKNLSFFQAPSWTNLPKNHYGVSVSLSGLNISWENIFHRYSDPPSTIKAEFTNGYSIEIYIGEEKQTHTIIRKSDKKIIRNKSEARDSYLPIISVLPQINPLQREEKRLHSDYVKSNLSIHLASNHFRNQLHLFKEDFFENFKNIAEANWQGLQIKSLEVPSLIDTDEPIELLVRDGNFVAEVGWMGHGLQMWLQTIWFIARSQSSQTIILDEPDVYMHPDLQRKLLRFLRGKGMQVVIATHSTEIMAETEPANILIIEKNRKESSFATTLPAVNYVLYKIGSAQNLQLTRLWSAGKIILVEGKDIKFLKKFQDILFPHSNKPFDAIPNMPIGGWSGWSNALGSAMLLTNSFGEQISIYCVLDSDYFTKETIHDRYNEASARNIRLHIWNKKEIENYLIVPTVINRVISKKCKTAPDTQLIIKKLTEITDDSKDETVDCYAQHFYNQNKPLGIKNANKLARELVENAWSSLDERISLISGKEVLSRLSSWTNSEFNVGLSAMSLLFEIKKDELHQEVIEIVTSIENGDTFDSLCPSLNCRGKLAAPR